MALRKKGNLEIRIIIDLDLLRICGSLEKTKDKDARISCLFASDDYKMSAGSIPNDCYCPITQEVMMDHIVGSDEHNY